MGFQECGNCQACCTVMRIDELNKPIRTVCEHQCETGCAIYGEHPQSCKNFMCVWVRGFGESWERPDKLGVFVEERAGPPDGRQMVVKEIYPGAVNSPSVRDYLLRLKQASGRNIYIMNHSMDTVIGEFVEITENKREKRKQRRKKLRKKG